MLTWISFPEVLGTDLEPIRFFEIHPSTRWDSNRRPGRVNPTRLVLAVRWERFEEVGLL